MLKGATVITDPFYIRNQGLQTWLPRPGHLGLIESAHLVCSVMNVVASFFSLQCQPEKHSFCSWRWG